MSSYTPTIGGVGTAVTVNGTGFDSRERLSRIDGAAATMPVSWTANKIVVPVPDGATTGQVTVTTQSGAGGPAGAPGVFRVAPRITTNVAALHVRTGETVDLSGFNLDEATW